MTWIFLWDASPSKIFIGGTQASKVFVWDTQVRPTWWQPWANTKVYYKINDNDTNTTIYDLTTNHYDQTWSWTPWYATDATYGRVANFNSNNYTLAGSIVDFWQEVTFITLIKPTSSAKAVVLQCATSSAWPLWMWLDSWKFIMSTISFWAINFESTSWIITSNQRTMLAATVSISNWTVKLYKNWILDKTYTGQTGTIDYDTEWSNLGIWYWRSWDGSRLSWNFKLFIWENRVWTDWEIAGLAREYGFNPS